MLIRRDHADVSGDHRSHEICHIAYLHVVLRGPNFVYFDFIWWWLRFELRFVCHLFFQLSSMSVVFDSNSMLLSNFRWCWSWKERCVG
ncbi:hypothetical protein MANES_06G062800v8 [Manihot esculenta]|uniref:Uncharacterized protein n=1 Tax=Manihot esculenta TaxID=3983 RepID=A0A2C9VQQ6_MANES|nr:hypothetical protein MANES_06G062800v8 [Manihot esculenta]